MTRIAIATPIRAVSSPLAGDVTYGFTRAWRSLSRAADVDVLGPETWMAPEDLDDVGYGPDLTRARSRIARIAMESKRDYSHILWWDSDVVPEDPDVVKRMFAVCLSGKHIVGAPYPRKRRLWDRAARFVAEKMAAGDPVTPEELEASTVDLPIFTAKDSPLEADLTAAVDSIGGGFLFTSLDALRAVATRYESTLTFGDVFHGRIARTIGIFHLSMPYDRDEPLMSPLLSEDYSFCWRAKRCGYQTYVYCGPGTPLSHAGMELFRAPA